MSFRRTSPAGLVSVGFQTISCANSTALGLNTTCQGGRIFHVSVETQNGRYRADGVAPALTTGVLLLTTNSPYWLEGIDPSKIKFQRATGTLKVSVMAYKRPGE